MGSRMNFVPELSYLGQVLFSINYTIENIIYYYTQFTDKKQPTKYTKNSQIRNILLVGITN